MEIIITESQYNRLFESKPAYLPYKDELMECAKKIMNFIQEKRDKKNYLGEVTTINLNLLDIDNVQIYTYSGNDGWEGSYDEDRNIIMLQGGMNVEVTENDIYNILIHEVEHFLGKTKYDIGNKISKYNNERWNWPQTKDEHKKLYDSINMIIYLIWNKDEVNAFLTNPEEYMGYLELVEQRCNKLLEYYDEGEDYIWEYVGEMFHIRKKPMYIKKIFCYKTLNQVRRIRKIIRKRDPFIKWILMGINCSNQN